MLPAPALLLLASLSGEAGELQADEIEVLAWSRERTAALLRLTDRKRDALELLVVDGASGATSRRLDLRPTTPDACVEFAVELGDLLEEHGFPLFVSPGWCADRGAALLIDPYHRASQPPNWSARTGARPEAIQIGRMRLGCLTAGIRGDSPTTWRNYVDCGAKTLLERRALTSEDRVTTTHAAPEAPRVALVVVAEPGHPAFLYPALHSADGTFDAPRVVPWRAPEPAPGSPRWLRRLTLEQGAAGLGVLVFLVALWLAKGAAILRRFLPPSR